MNSDHKAERPFVYIADRLTGQITGRNRPHTVITGDTVIIGNTPLWPAQQRFQVRVPARLHLQPLSYGETEAVRSALPAPSERRMIRYTD